MRALQGSQYAIDTLFRAYVGIINVIIHKYNNRATEDDTQDAYELAVKIIRSHDPKQSTLTMHFDKAIRTLFADQRKTDRGTDAMDRALSLEPLSEQEGLASE
jgi:ssRNA-specific RNase YbeY (16S rRNA maturation enzyme)